MMIEGTFLNIFDGEFSLGIYTLQGEDENGSFNSIQIGFAIFELSIIYYL